MSAVNWFTLELQPTNDEKTISAKDVKLEDSHPSCPRKHKTKETPE